MQLLFLMEPFQYDFMQDALVTGIVVGTVCAVLSCFLVLKGWALLGDAISHAVLPGIVIAHIAGIALAIGAFASGIACIVMTGYIREHSRLKEDTVLGIVFSGMFALGLVLFARIETDQHLTHILFGNILGISRYDYWQTILISLFVLAAACLFRKDILLFCFDRRQARLAGLPVRLIHYALLGMVTLTIVAAIQAVGVVLVIAMLVAPGITAFLLARKFSRMLVIAVLVSIFSVVTGIMISFHIDGATGACIVLVHATLFLTALSVSKTRLLKS